MWIDCYQRMKIILDWWNRDQNITLYNSFEWIMVYLWETTWYDEEWSEDILDRIGEITSSDTSHVFASFSENAGIFPRIAILITATYILVHHIYKLFNGT